MEIESEIKFGDAKAKKSYEDLSKGKHEEEELKKWLDVAFGNLEKNAFCGIQVPKRLVPREYAKRFGEIDNLWKYDLPNAWRLIYTVKREKVIVLSIILEWLDHKEYEKRLKY